MECYCKYYALRKVKTMFKNKAKIKRLEAELSHAQKQLCKALKELEKEKSYSAYCWDGYAKYVCQCEKLTKEIEALKTENRKLELIIQAFKAVEEAHKHCKGKEA